MMLVARVSGLSDFGIGFAEFSAGAPDSHRGIRLRRWPFTIYEPASLINPYDRGAPWAKASTAELDAPALDV